MDYTSTLAAISDGLNPTRVYDALVVDAKAEIINAFNQKTSQLNRLCHEW